MEYFPLFQPLWKRLPRRLHHTCTVAMQQVGLPSFKIDLHVLIGLLTTKKATSTAATASFQHHHLALYKATIWFVFTEGFSIKRILGATDETSFNNTCCWLASLRYYESVSEIESDLSWLFFEATISRIIMFQVITTLWQRWQRWTEKNSNVSLSLSLTFS